MTQGTIRTMWCGLAALLVATGLVAVSARRAEADTPPNLGDFRLRRTELDLAGRVRQLDAQLPKLGVQNILAQANRRARQEGGPADPCNAAAFGGRQAPNHWCWDRADTGVVGGDEGNGTVEWMPQGVTTVADAQADELWGSKQAILVSWYDKRLAPEKGVRVSFLDPQTGRYQHVLLAYPYVDAGGNPTYEILDTPQEGDHGGIHAGGIAWYGTYLYVADTTRGIRVLDMRYIFDLQSAGNGDTTDQTRIGRHGGTYYGFGYRYVMPQVDAWVNDVGADNDGDFACEASGAPKFSSIGVDRSATPDRLVTSEYCSNSSGAADKDGRVATWSLDGATGRPLPGGDGKWHATSAHRLPEPNIQGPVVSDGVWYLSRSRGEDANGYLIEAAASGSPTGTLSTTRTRWAGVGVEDLSYWPGQDAIWTTTEHPGKRAVYACPGAATPGPAGAVCGTAG